MLKILRTTLRQPCGLAKRKMVLRLPQEIPQKCVRRQVHGCRRADVKRALGVILSTRKKLMFGSHNGSLTPSMHHHPKVFVHVSINIIA